LTKENPASRRLTVISADSHVNIPETAFAEYFPAHLKDRTPRVERGADRDTVVFEGKRTNSSRGLMVG
jgi:hypothetical protein